MGAPPPPPATWLRDIPTVAANQISAPAGPPLEASLDERRGAARKITEVLAAEDRQTGVDLADLLENGARAEYSFQQYGWPAALVDVRQNSLPQLVLERYNTRQSVCFCGVFVDICHAWVTVDQTLFLWNFRNPNAVPKEFSVGEQAIITLGLVKPPAGVFQHEVHYLLIAATTVEIMLIGMHIDPSGEISKQLIPFPQYSCPTNGVCMLHVASTSHGRIFCGGSDGHLYEVLYRADEGWGKRRCQLACHSSGLLSYYSRLLPSVLRFGSPQPVKQVAVDEERGILYTRSEGGSLACYDLGGPECKGAPKHVASISDLYTELQNERSRGSRAAADRGADAARKAVAPVHIAPVPLAESLRLQLVCVCHDGRRLFLSVHPKAPYGSSAPAPSPSARPSALRVVNTERYAPSGGAPQGAELLAPAPRLLEVETAFSGAGGLLVLSDARANAETSRLLVVSRDATLPKPGAALALRESVASAQLDGHAVASVGVLLEVPPPTHLLSLLAPPWPAGAAPPPAGSPLPLSQAPAPRGELQTQHALPRRHVVFMTTAGLVELDRARPVDTLADLLRTGARAQVESFFAAYGPAEAAAMCLQLATSPPAGAEAVPAAVADAARRAWEDPKLVGEATLDSLAAVGGVGGVGVGGFGVGGFGSPGGGVASPLPQRDFDTGSVVVEPQVKFSAAFEGLVLFSARLLRPVWDRAVAARVGGDAAQPLVAASCPEPVLADLEGRLRVLDALLRSRRWGPAAAAGAGGGLGGSAGGALGAAAAEPLARQRGALLKRRRLDEPAAKEERLTAVVAATVRLAAEALALLRVVGRHRFEHVAQKLEPQHRQRLCQLSLSALVSTADGAEASRRLIDALVSHVAVDRKAPLEPLSQELSQRCPQLFSERTRVFFRARELLARARDAPAASPARAQLLSDALALLLEVPLEADLAATSRELAALQFWDGVVQLPLRHAAAASDAAAAAGRFSPDGTPLAPAAQAAYDVVADALRGLVLGQAAPSAGASGIAAVTGGLDAQSRAAGQRALLASASRALASDRAFADRLYRVLVELRCDAELLALPSDGLQEWLARQGGLSSARRGEAISPAQASLLALLAKLLAARGRFSEAARCLSLVAERAAPAEGPPVALEERYQLLSAALLHAKAQPPDSALADRLQAGEVERLEGRLAVLSFQLRLAKELRERAQRAGGGGAGAGSSAQLREDADALEKGGVRTLTELYNDFAAKHRLWGLSAEMLAFSGYQDDPSVPRLVWDNALSSAAEGLASGPAALAAAAECAASVGAAVFPNDTAFPLAHVALRLEQMAAGLWPPGASPADDNGPVAPALLRACKGNAEALQAAYDSLLARRAGDLHAPHLRLLLLRSQLAVLRAAADQAGRVPGAAYRRGALADLCDHYKADALRLQVRREEAEAVAAAFQALRDEVVV